MAIILNIGNYTANTLSFVVEAQEVLLWVLLSQSCFQSFKDSKKLNVLKHLLQLNCPLRGFVRFLKAAGTEHGHLRKFRAIIEYTLSASFSHKGSESPSHPCLYKKQSEVSVPRGPWFWNSIRSKRAHLPLHLQANQRMKSSYAVARCGWQALWKPPFTSLIFAISGSKSMLFFTLLCQTEVGDKLATGSLILFGSFPPQQ